MASDWHLRFLEFLVKPIAKFCFRHHLTYQDINAVLREQMVAVIAKELRQKGKKVNASRISMITGLYREEVSKYLADRAPQTNEGDQGLLAAVIGQWERDPEFLTTQRKPRVLGFDSDQSEFHRLVSKVRRGAYAPTVLFALEQIGAVKKGSRGLKLIRGGAVTNPLSDENFDLLSRDIEAFILATEQNIAKPDSIGEAYIRTEYDNISREKLPEIRRWLVAHTKAFHKKARGYLSRFDKDLNPEISPETEAGERVILHAFSLSNPTPEKD
ncbi:MAG: hypothetical protein KDD55_11790 [Bdellovibrionales bacterium]|nr:hypothetical protein [Bdellovibrionales bacterium]